MQTICKKALKTVRAGIAICIMLCYGNAFSQTTTTVTFKPGAVLGQDAGISINQVYYWANRNSGNETEFKIYAWTWQMNSGIVRSLLRFDELSTIPVNAVITNAELKLYGADTMANHHGNSSYSGSPYNVPNHIWGYQYNTTNESWIEKVTNAWDEQTVTWNTQPSTTTQNRIAIPNTTSQWNWDFTDNSADLVTMVQEWVSCPDRNFGVMFKLQTESHYRCVFFASSDHSNAALHPELTVTYYLSDEIVNPCDTVEPCICYNCETKQYYEIDCDIECLTPSPDKCPLTTECPCEANFSYMASTVSGDYSFMALNSAIDHKWNINGHDISGSSFIYTFSAGEYQICYRRISEDGTECEKCILICVQENKDETDNGEEGKEMKALNNIREKDVIQGNIPPGDIITNEMMENNKVKIYPNPTNNEWNIDITEGIADKVTISVYDMNGKLVYNKTNAIVSGENLLKVNPKNLPAGSYILEIKGNSINFKERVIKY